MKFIHLTGLRKELNEEAQRRLDEWEGDNYEEPVDSDGKNREFYESMGIPVPKEILDKEKNLEKDITFTEEDYDSHAVEVLINLDSFSMCIDTIDDEGIVFLKDGTYCNVLETKQEIYDQIKWETRSFWNKFKQIIKK